MDPRAIQQFLNSIQSGIQGGQITSLNAGQFQDVLRNLSGMLQQQPQTSPNQYGYQDQRGNQYGGDFGGFGAEPPSWLQNFIGQAERGNQQYLQGLEGTLAASRMSFDAQKSQSNLYYRSAIEDLRQSREKALQVGMSNAQALNPYATARGASTARNFSNGIEEKYALAEARISAQADAAMQALTAGEYQAAAQIQAQIGRSIQEANQQTFSMLWDFTKTAEQQRQFQVSQGHQQERAAVDDLRQFMTTLSGSPELQTEIGSYFSEGRISQGLMPLVERGIEAGYSPNETLSLFQYQTDAWRKQVALEDYRNEQLIMSQNRLAQSQDRQYLWQARIASAQNISNVATTLITEGYTPGSLEYALGLAQATVASPDLLPSAEVEKYTNLGILSGQFRNVKGRIDTISKNSSLWNVIVSKNPQAAQGFIDQNVDVLNREMQSMAGILGKSVFAEQGNLSNRDIERVLVRLPYGATTNEVKKQLYNGLVDLLAEKAVLTLQNHAGRPYNVGSYGHIVQGLVDQANTLTGGGSGGGANSYNYGGQTYRLPYLP
jgi:hypothetical protein